MAAKSINLLQPDELSTAEQKRNYFLKMGTIFLIVFYCLVVLAFFSYSLVVLRESQMVERKIESEKIRLEELRQVELLQFVLKQRLSTLNKEIELDRLKPKEWLSYLDGLVPEGVYLEGTQWDPQTKVNFSGKADNAVTLAGFLDTLKKEADNQKLAQVILVSATRQKEGNYSFSMEIVIKEEE